jgi:hypothetical protein
MNYDKHKKEDLRFYFVGCLVLADDAVKEARYEEARKQLIAAMVFIDRLEEKRDE